MGKRLISWAYQLNQWLLLKCYNAGFVSNVGCCLRVTVTFGMLFTGSCVIMKRSWMLNWWQVWVAVCRLLWHNRQIPLMLDLWQEWVAVCKLLWHNRQIPIVLDLWQEWVAVCKLLWHKRQIPIVLDLWQEWVAVCRLLWHNRQIPIVLDLWQEWVAVCRVLWRNRQIPRGDSTDCGALQREKDQRQTVLREKQRSLLLHLC